MADVKWIKIATNIFDNKKIRIIEAMPEGDSILIVWFKILMLAGNVNDDGYVYFTKDLAYTDQMLSTLFNRPLPIIQLALSTFESFGMIEIIDDIIHISNWEKYQNVEGLEKVREQTRQRVSKYRERKRLECNVTDNVTVTQGNGTDIDIKKENKNIIYGDFSEEDFEKLWKMYPRKKGKGQISKTCKTKIAKIGFDRMAKAIENFKRDMQGKDEQYIMYGSTFFNSGYVDYLPQEEEKPVMEEPQDNGLTEEEIDAMTDEEYAAWHKSMENGNV